MSEGVRGRPTKIFKRKWAPKIFYAKCLLIRIQNSAHLCWWLILMFKRLKKKNIWLENLMCLPYQKWADIWCLFLFEEFQYKYKVGVEIKGKGWHVHHSQDGDSILLFAGKIKFPSQDTNTKLIIFEYQKLYATINLTKLYEKSESMFHIHSYWFIKCPSSISLTM